VSLKTINDYALFQALLGGFLPCDKETKSTDSDINYYGYENRHGEWYIMEEDLSPAGGTSPNSWRYIKGDSDYATNWTGREALSYSRTSTAFK